MVILLLPRAVSETQNNLSGTTAGVAGTVAPFVLITEGRGGGWVGGVLVCIFHNTAPRPLSSSPLFFFFSTNPNSLH